MVINGGSSFLWQCKQSKRKVEERGGGNQMGFEQFFLPARKSSVAWNLFRQVVNEISSNRLLSEESIFLLVFTRHYKLLWAQTVKGQRGISAEVCGNVLLMTSLGIGMLWVRSQHVTHCDTESPPVAWGGVGVWEHWPHEFLGCDLMEMLNEVPPCFTMMTELLIYFHWLLNEWVWIRCPAPSLCSGEIMRLSAVGGKWWVSSAASVSRWKMNVLTYFCNLSIVCWIQTAVLREISSLMNKALGFLCL